VRDALNKKHLNVGEKVIVMQGLEEEMVKEASKIRIVTAH